jgi:hypothetical protein
VRPLCLIALVTAAAALTACGDASKPSPPGSPDNPLVAKPTEETSTDRSNEAAKASEDTPGYQKLVERQSSRPRTRFTPCNLVTKAQAGAILASPVQAPLQAPQGPTCIYRTRAGKSFVTIAVQSRDFGTLKRQIQRPQRVSVSDRPAYCGTYGQPMLYASLSRGRVLSVSAPCGVAKQFAMKAVQRLGG